MPRDWASMNPEQRSEAVRRNWNKRRENAERRYREVLDMIEDVVGPVPGWLADRLRAAVVR